MAMRDSYWSFMEQTNFAYRYYQAYYMRVCFFQRSIRIFSALVTCSSVALWSGWNQLPGLWASLIFLSEVVNVIMPLLPFSDRANALKFLIPRFQELAQSVENTWSRIDGTSDDAFRDPLCDYRDKSASLESQFLGADVIPTRRRLARKIGLLTAEHMRRYFYPKGGEPTDG